MFTKRSISLKSNVSCEKNLWREIHTLINNYMIKYNIFNNNNNNFILGTFRFLATMRFHRQELPPYLGEFVHALNKALATTQTQLSRPMGSGHHMCMEHRQRRKQHTLTKSFLTPTIDIYADIYIYIKKQQTEGETDRQTNKQTNKQATDMCIYIYICA